MQMQSSPSLQHIHAAVWDAVRERTWWRNAACWLLKHVLRYFLDYVSCFAALAHCCVLRVWPADRGAIFLLTVCVCSRLKYYHQCPTGFPVSVCIAYSCHVFSWLPYTVTRLVRATFDPPLLLHWFVVYKSPFRGRLSSRCSGRWWRSAARKTFTGIYDDWFMCHLVGRRDTTAGDPSCTIHEYLQRLHIVFFVYTPSY